MIKEEIDKAVNEAKKNIKESNLQLNHDEKFFFNNIKYGVDLLYSCIKSSFKLKKDINLDEPSIEFNIDERVFDVLEYIIAFYNVPKNERYLIAIFPLLEIFQIHFSEFNIGIRTKFNKDFRQSPKEIKQISKSILYKLNAEINDEKLWEFISEKLKNEQLKLDFEIFYIQYQVFIEILNFYNPSNNIKKQEFNVSNEISPNDLKDNRFKYKEIRNTAEIAYSLKLIFGPVIEKANFTVKQKEKLFGLISDRSGRNLYQLYKTPTFKIGSQEKQVEIDCDFFQEQIRKVLNS